MAYCRYHLDFLISINVFNLNGVNYGRTSCCTIKNKYYKDWSEEDIKNFFDIVMEGQEKLKNDQDDYDYDNE